MGKIDETYTVDQFVKMRTSDEITYYNFSILDYKNSTEYPVTNVIYDYIDELKEQSIVITLSDIEMLRYKYRPGLLAYDKYGATELAFIILALNNMVDEDEFDIKNVRLLQPSVLSLLLGRIFSAESTYINSNRTKIKNMRKADADRAVGL